jgi:hypothetical protein
MPERDRSRSHALTVIDALDHPHGGRILRVRAEGDPPSSLRKIKGARFRAVSPDGIERSIRVLDFALFGGKPSNERFSKTGRVDLRVEELDEGPSVSTTWTLHPGSG